MPRISVIHFQPLEYFPPGLNFVRYLSAQDDLTVSVSTTRQAEQPFYIELSERVELHAFNTSSHQARSRIGRAVKYIQFVFSAVRQIRGMKPDVVVYFDPYSAWPGIIYKLLINRKVRLWIHFHEYFEPQWYANGMFSVRVAHLLERRFIFERALGISHTNRERVQLFHEDNPEVESSKLFAFPNYPPSEWGQHHHGFREVAPPTKFVALGSFTLKDTYLREFCEWVEGQVGAATLDIYSLYYDVETRGFLEQQNRQLVRFHSEGVPYDLIPSLFESSNFHIGLVLYRCNHINTINCVSNKVFEYLVCGLDVWYPREMTGTAPYATDGTYPKVLPVDFQHLDAIDLQTIQSRDGQRHVKTDVDCETVYAKWVAKLLEAS